MCILRQKSEVSKMFLSIVHLANAPFTSLSFDLQLYWSYLVLHPSLPFSNSVFYAPLPLSPSCSVPSQLSYEGLHWTRVMADRGVTALDPHRQRENRHSTWEMTHSDWLSLLCFILSFFYTFFDLRNAFRGNTVAVDHHISREVRV